MTYSLIALIALSVFGCIILLYYRKKCLKRTGEASLSAVSEFEVLSHPTRLFSSEDVNNFLEENKQLVDTVRGYMKSIFKKEKLIKQYSFENLLNYYDSCFSFLIHNNELYYSICYLNENLQRLLQEQNALNETCFYQAHHNIEFHKEKCRDLICKIALLEKNDCLKYIDNNSLVPVFLDGFYSVIKEENIKLHNEKCVEESKKKNEHFFDSCLKYPLDEQQRDAILHLEDNNLVIASAGSGKTSTMVGKAKYMVEVEKINPKKILILTYTRKAAAELTDRLGIEGLSCSTFHALALLVISKLTNHKPTISSPDFMLNCFYNLFGSDENFKDAINKYFINTRSLMKVEHEYVTAEEYYADRKKYGIQAIFKDMHGKIIFTKSEEERRICEWLSIHGIHFTYEEEYEEDTSTDKYRQYRPDFSIYYKNEEGEDCRLYLEHFAINKDCEVPLWFGTDYNSPDQNDEDVVRRWEEANRIYKEGIDWKKQLHAKNKTTLISTTSAMFHDNTVWDNLERQLTEQGISVKELSPDEIFIRLAERDKGLERSIYKLIEQFTILLKSNLRNIDDLISSAANQNDNRSKFIIENIMKPFVNFYSSELKKKGSIDFTDAILYATELCNKGDWVDYDYILVDEFQDISKDRYLFLKSLRKSNAECFTKLFCVGDDWQSIYRFSGSDMTLFYDFEKFFGFTKNCKIETTYRFHNPLIRISSAFIQNNPNQVKKTIRDFFVKSDEYKALENEYKKNAVAPSSAGQSNYEVKRAASEKIKAALEDLAPHTQIVFHEFCSDYDEKVKVEALIRDIPMNEDILVIARYNYDSKSLGFRFTPQDADKKTIWLNLANRKVRFMSVHGSKGLEADHVILINCNRGVNGFPSLIEDDPILSFVLSDKDQFENAEERRVFYVAITRARKNMHVFYCEACPSCFVDEVIGEEGGNNSVLMPCPTCGQGYIHPVKEGVGFYGRWVALACSNKAGGCPYFKLMGKSQYVDMVEEFKSRNSISPVQEVSKNMSARIEELIKNVKLKRKNETAMNQSSLLEKSLLIPEIENGAMEDYVREVRKMMSQLPKGLFR